MIADRGLFAATALALMALILNVASVSDLAWVPPDAASLGIVARSLVEGHGYTENVVPFHPAPFASVRHVPEMHGLLQPVLLAPLLALLGESPVVLRLPSLAFATFSGVVVFVWARYLFGTAAGLLACLLTVLNGNLAAIGVFGTDDAGFAFFVVATLAALERALDTRSDRVFLLAGVLAASALLQKAAGVVLLGVLLAVPLFPPRARPRALLMLWTPFLAALGLYFLRNYLAHGSVAFRISPLDLYLRADGYEGMMRLFAEPPGFSETLRGLGPGRVADLVARELQKLVTIVWPAPPWALTRPFFALASPAFLLPLGLVSVPLLAPWYGVAAALTALTVTGMAVFLGVLWHTEVRFLAFLAPLSALWVAGLLATGTRLVARSRRRPAFAAAGVLAAALVFPAAWSFASAQRAFRTVPDLSACRGALDWLEANSLPGDRVLTFDPWFTSWLIRRDAVMIPSGGATELTTVARRYDAHWLVTWGMFSRPATSRALMSLRRREDGVVVAREYDDGICRVHRLVW